MHPIPRILFSKLVFVFFAAVLPVSFTMAQSAKQGNTIFKLLGLKPGGCPVTPGSDDYLVEISEVNSMDEDEAPKMPDINGVMKNCTPLFSRSKELADKYQKKASPVTFANGNYLFQEQGLYGLKDVQNNIVLQAKFHQVIADGKDGFVGYEGQFCSYYSNTGAKLLPGNYYSIQHTPKNTFIVQTEKGYGIVLPGNKSMVTPKYERIEFQTQNENFYYWLYSSDTGFWLSENGKDTIRLNSADYVTMLDSKNWLYAGSLFKTKPLRRFICDEGYFTELVSAKDKLLAINDPKTNKYYLVDFDGNLITNQPFVKIHPHLEHNSLLMEVNDNGKTDEYGYNYTKVGLMNLKGQWLIPPVYKNLNFLGDKLFYATDANNKHGVINMANQIVVPFKYRETWKVNDHQLLGIMLENNEVKSDLINLSDGKVVMSGLPYQSISLSTFCNDTVYIAQGKRDECILNNKFEMLSPASYSRISYTLTANAIIGMNFTQNGEISESCMFDCTGKKKSFEINGTTYDKFYQYTQICPDLAHILIRKDSGFFISASGKITPDNHYWSSISYANAKDLFSTQEGSKFGIINSLGETVIPPVFNYISSFDAEGLARYDYDNRQKGYLSSDGELLFGAQYLETDKLGLGLLRVKRENMVGVLDRQGKVIVPLQYDHVSLDGGIIKAWDHSKVYRFDILGNRVN